MFGTLCEEMEAAGEEEYVMFGVDILISMHIFHTFTTLFLFNLCCRILISYSDCTNLRTL